MERKLDRTRPFATLYGPDPNLPKGPNGQLPKFQQNNMYFDQAGNYVAGEYKAADSEDVKRDLQAENARLKAELEALKGAPKEPETKLNREQIIAQLKKLGVKFDGRSNDQALYDLLQSKLDEE